MARKGIPLPPANARFRPLTEDDMETIEVTALRALKDVGMVAEHEDVLKLAEASLSF